MQPFGLVQDRPERLAFASVVVFGVGLEQGRDPVPDRLQRRAEVVRDGGEHRGPSLVGFGVGPRRDDLRVEAGSLEDDRHLPGGGLQQSQVVALDGRAARRPHGDERAEPAPAALERDLGRLPFGEPLAPANDLVPERAGPHLDLAAGEAQRAEEGARQVIEHLLEGFAGQDLRREVAQQPRLALTTGGPRPLLQRARDSDPTIAATMRKTTSATTSSESVTRNVCSGSVK